METQSQLIVLGLAVVAGIQAVALAWIAMLVARERAADRRATARDRDFAHAVQREGKKSG